MAPQAPRPALNDDRYVALVSGLGVGDDAGDPLRLSLLVDYLTGLLGSNEEQNNVITKVSLCLHHFSLSDVRGQLALSTSSAYRARSS